MNTLYTATATGDGPNGHASFHSALKVVAGRNHTSVAARHPRPPRANVTPPKQNCD